MKHFTAATINFWRLWCQRLSRRRVNPPAPRVQTPHPPPSSAPLRPWSGAVHLNAAPLWYGLVL